MFKTISAKNKLVTVFKAVGLCIMSACVCLSAVFSVPRKTTFASTTGSSQVESLSAGSEVYFGEYPQSTVIRVRAWQDRSVEWTETQTVNGIKQKISYSETVRVPQEVDKDSVNIHTEIKNKIQSLIANYYSTEHTIAEKKTKIKENYNWHNTTIGYFAPREDWTYGGVSYDNETGYYTLLEPVTEGNISYSAGSKFYPYNRVMDSVNKYYRVYVAPNGTGSNAGKYVWLDSSRNDKNQNPHQGVDPDIAPIRVYETVSDWSNMYILDRNNCRYNSIVRDKNDVVALHGYDRFQTSEIDNSDTVDETATETGTGVDGIFLYEVEPIKWTVVDSPNLQLSGSSGNYKMLISTNVIDSNAINHYPWAIMGDATFTYGTKFSQSVLKAWLNGQESVLVTRTSSTTVNTDTFYLNNRTFYNLAFSSNKNKDDLQTFYRTDSTKSQKVGLLTSNELTDISVYSSNKTEYALANGDQGSLDKYRWMIDDEGPNWTFGRTNLTDESQWIQMPGSSGYGIYGVRPVICLDISTFANENKVGDIDAGNTVNISEPLKMNENYNVKNASFTIPNLLHIKSEGVDGSIIVTQSGDMPTDSSDTLYGKSYTVTTSGMTVNGEPATTGFIVAGIRTYTNIKDSPDSYDKQFVPASSYLGGENSSSTITLSNVEGQFVLTFYLIFEGGLYFIPAEKITNPIIYTTMDTSNANYTTNSGRSPFSPVNFNVARRLSGNEIDVDVGNMSKLYFSETVELSTDYSFKYKTVFQSLIIGTAFQVPTGKSATLAKIIFDGQDIERAQSFVSVNGTGQATFDDCIIKNANGKSNGGALKIGTEATLSGAKLEVSNSKTTGEGGGIYCEGKVDMKELLLNNNYSSSGAASLTAITTTTKSFNISTRLYVTNNKEQTTSGAKYSNYAVSISGYNLYINTPTFKDNNIWETALYLNNCKLLSDKTVTFENGLFEGNNARGTNNGYASAMIVDANGIYTYRFSNSTFRNNSSSESGYGTVVVKGAYQSASKVENGVYFDGCTFKDNNGLYSGGLSFLAIGAGDNFSGNFAVTNTNFYGNSATSTSEDATEIAGALLVKTNSSKDFKKLAMSNLTFQGNKAKFYGVANFIFDVESDKQVLELTLDRITVGGEVSDGNKLDEIRNISTSSGALFAIQYKSSSSGITKRPAVAISNFYAKNNLKNDISSSNFANSGVLYLNDIVSKDEDDILIKDSKFVNNEGVSNGGALIIQDCSGVVQNCLFEDNRVFVSGNKTSGVGGGAVYLTNTDNESEIGIKNSTFTNNSVTASGEGLFAGGGAILSKKTILTLTDIYAYNNSVDSGKMVAKGGAICSYDNTTYPKIYSTECQHSSPKLVIFGGKFDDNSATSSNNAQGGAVWGECVQIVAGTETADYKTAVRVLNGVVIFSNNKTKNGEAITGEGGAIYTANCFKILNEKDIAFVVEFTGNSSLNGGAVRARGVSIIDGARFENNGTPTLDNDVFGYGGAISFGNSELTIKYSDYVTGSLDSSTGIAYELPMSAKIVRATFVGNEANYGGAIFSDSTIQDVGFAKFSELVIVGKVGNLINFEKNKAIYNENRDDASGTGGAIYAKSPLKIDMVSFDTNEANFASTIYFDNSAKTFTYASSSYVATDKLTVSNTTFKGNISSTLGVIGASSFVDITISNSSFTSNKNKGAILEFSNVNGALKKGTLDSCSFTNNISEATNYLADAISVVKGCEVVIKDCTFAQNGDTTKSGYGTAILVGNGGVVYLNNIEANGTESNKITNTNGFILVQNGGNLNVSGGTISYLENKNSSYGGGVAVVSGRASFDGITLSNCVALNGGAIYVKEGGNVSFAGTISGCAATENGGAIYVESGATLLVSGELKTNLTYSESVISNNSAQNGGGVFSFGDTTVSRASILNNTVSNNGGGICSKENSSLTIEQDAIISENTSSSDGRGAGIYAMGNLYMNGATISGNNFGESVEKGVGGGLYAEKVSFEAKNMIFSGNSAGQGGAIFVSGGAISLSYSSLSENSATNGGAVYLQNCTTDIISCDFKKNGATGQGRAVFVSGGNLVAEDSSFDEGQSPSEDSTAKLYASCVSLVLSGCKFVNTVAYDNNGHVSNLYVSASRSVEILDSNFNYGLCRGTESGVVISAPNVWVENCNFNGNADGGLSLTTNYGVIANSKFSANKKNDGLKLNKLDGYCSVEIIDSSFTNGNASTSVGGAIYVPSGVNLRLSGKIVVTGNTSTNGAIYIASGGKIVITRGSNVVISGNTIPTSDTTRNLVFEESADTAFLEGGLLEGSSIGITVISGSVVAQSPMGIPLEADDVKKLFSDDSSHYFSYSANSNKLSFYSDTSKVKSVTVEVANTEETKEIICSVILSDITLLYYNMPEGGYVIDKSYFEVKSGDKTVEIVSMTFGLKEGTGFLKEYEESITLSEKGSYTLSFAIKEIRDGDSVGSIDSNKGDLAGEIVVNIVGEYLYIISTPQATMISGDESSFKITQSGLVKRSNGQEVAGTWSLTSPNSVKKSGYYDCNFTPKQTLLYENRTNLTGKMYVNVTYDKMYYTMVNSEDGIYADSEGKNRIDVNSFAEAMELLNDNGTFVFKTVYSVQGNETIAISKRIKFVRESSGTNFAMIEVGKEGSLTISCTSGQALFEGKNDSAQYPVFVVNGKLTLGSNVAVRNFTYTSYASALLHGIICNKGTLVLQGCKIYDNEINFASSSGSVIGGVVYNEGKMSILSGEFYGNKATKGNGGFVYTAGKLTVSGGTISNNESGSGAGVYVANGGSASLLSGQIIHNIAEDNGGGVFVASGGKLNIDNTQILSNIASEGAGLYKDEGGVVLLSSGEALLTSTIESVEAVNTIKTSEQSVQKDNLATILNTICLLIAVAIFVIFVTKSKKSQTFDKK